MATTLISNISRTSSVQDIKQTKTLSNIKPFNATNFQQVSYAKVTTLASILPFRLTLTNIGLEGFASAYIPGIGIQVIGFSNYIL